MRKFQHIFTAALVAIPMILSAQNAANPGSGPANNKPNPAVQQQADDDSNGTVKVYYDGKVKIIVRNVNGTTVITYDSSALNGNKPGSAGYAEDIFDVFKDIKELEDKEKESELRDNTGNEGGRTPWKLVVEGNIAGVHDQKGDNEGYGMSPPIRFERTNSVNCTDCPQNKPADEMAQLADEIMVYPNPASSFITVQLKNSDLAAVRVLDMSGKQVKVASDLQQYNARVEVSDLTNGVYLVEITSAGETAVKRFVKF